MNENSQIVIVGAGIIGASIAFQLSRRHRNVTVVDSAQPGRAATRASYAWINSRDKSPREYHDLNRRSLDMWSRYAHDLNADVGLRWGGEMRWTATDQGASELTDQTERLLSWGYPIVEISKAQARAMEPGIVMEPFTSAVFCGIEGHVDTQKVVRACLNHAQQAGANVLTNDPVTAIESEPGADGKSAVKTVQLASGTSLDCEVLVLAAGFETTGLAAMAGIEFSQRTSPGATIVTEPTSPIFRNVVCMHTPRDLPEPLMNVRQFSDGSVMVHGGNHDGSIGDSSDDDANKLLYEISRFIPSLSNTKVKEIRRGMRPMPEDGLPVIGFAESVPNLYFAVMHSGVTLAALTGEFAALEILDEATIDLLAPYRLNRFGA